MVYLSNVLLTLIFTTGWFQGRIGHWMGLESGFPFHLAGAAVAVLISLFCNVSVLFYFIGTGVWIKDKAKSRYAQHRESAEAMWAIFEKANKLKGKSFPFASFGLVLGLFSFVLGGATQVGAAPHWLHPLVGGLFVVLSWSGTKWITQSVYANVKFLDQVTELDDKIEERGTLHHG